MYSSFKTDAYVIQNPTWLLR